MYDPHRILITDHIGEVKTLESDKVIEKIEREEKAKKDEEKRVKEVEEEERKKKRHEEKIRKIEKRNKERTPTSSEKDATEFKETKTVNEPILNEAAANFANPKTDIPLDQVTILKKNKEIEPEVVDKKKTKQVKTKNVVSLEEFNNAAKEAQEGSGSPEGWTGEYQNRIERLAAIKKTFEQRETSPSYTNYSHGAPFQPTHAPIQTQPLAASSNLEAKIDKYLGRPSKEQVAEDVVVESIKVDVLQKLHQLGPLQESDPRLVSNLSAEGRALVTSRRGLVAFLKSDERFGSYAGLVCLKGEAERAKVLHEQEDRMVQDFEAKAREEEQGSRPMSNLGEPAKRMREQLEASQGGQGRQVEEVAAEVGPEPMVVDREVRDLVEGFVENKESSRVRRRGTEK